MKNRFILGDIVEEGVIEFINFSGNEYAIGKDGEFIVTTTPTPLPLTYDFLKKHGFKNIGSLSGSEKHNGDLVYCNRDIGVNFYIVGIEGINFRIVSYEMELIWASVKYVHEFQHFLFGIDLEL